MADVNLKLQKCEVCAASDAKYTCPKCEVRTCCIACANIHKKELECDGIRDKTKYVPLKSFTDLDLLSDYRFLEDMGRSVDRIQKDQSELLMNYNHFPVKLQKLKAAAFHRGINLCLLPLTFSRSKENTTFLHWKTGELFWRIQWIFPQAENTKWIVERASESIRLSVLVEQVLNPVSSSLKHDDNNCAEETDILSNLRERLKFYQAAGLCGLKILLKAECIEKSDLRFHELDLTLTLKENLQNKTIIEFPTLLVVLRDHAHIYDVIDSDEENIGDKQYEPFNRHICKRIKYSRRPNKIKKESTNFFFDTECSDSADETQENVSNVEMKI